jgi:uncharacterized protein
MLIDVRPMLKGDVREIKLDYLTPPPEDFNDIHFTGDIRITGEIVNHAGYQTLDAVAEVPFTTHCSRCWKDISRIFTLDIHKVLATRQSLQNQTEENDDYLMIEDQKIDLDSPLLEAIMLEFPYTFVCKEDCKGLCTKCGKDLNEGDCDCPKKEIDPRLAILQKLLDK